MTLPRFTYHPDPLATGSIRAADGVCDVCGRVRGYTYAGPVYAVEEVVDCICPWCIADGSAHEKLDAEFVDIDGVGDHGTWPEVPRAVAEEVAWRTPGFAGWQQERWFTCCKDAAEFLGRAGNKELTSVWSSAQESIRNEAGLDGVDWLDYLEALDGDGSPTAYVFRCRHCGQLGGYSDCD